MQSDDAVEKYMGRRVDKHFWDSFFGKAKEMGFRPRNVILVILAGFAFTAMAVGKLSPGWAITAVVIFYCLDDILKLIKSDVRKRNVSNIRDVYEDQFKQFLKDKRRELKQSELPFPSIDKPRSDQNDHH
ncbi:hypothetical protein [Tardiphaga sp. 285_C5_N1_2]|uniref:hypothetical protein n=1 Tax=Tardiphaga sp. 285_C5_N1_2 TaxID=3240775 RepID=UPI003F8AB6FC